ncbi:hypothetical protein LEP1GSC052_3352 [Leptospira kmetyi serovar Malaysia str. Bejo-Iso9]|nr:hypothetical protein LEP1GSC052_3352 [Leptospira kmetyi serovar Malaysia str. Bejo-Iso9]
MGLLFYFKSALCLSFLFGFLLSAVAFQEKRRMFVVKGDVVSVPTSL